MGLVNTLAEDTAKNFAGPNAALDPATLQAFIELILQVIQAIKNCRATPPDAAIMVSRPTMWQKMVVRQTVRRNMSFREYRDSGEQVVDALLKTGKTVSQSEIEQLLLET